MLSRIRRVFEGCCRALEDSALPADVFHPVHFCRLERWVKISAAIRRVSVSLFWLVFLPLVCVGCGYLPELERGLTPSRGLILMPSLDWERRFSLFSVPPSLSLFFVLVLFT